VIRDNVQYLADPTGSKRFRKSHAAGFPPRSSLTRW
jgi:hypothetical protein